MFSGILFVCLFFFLKRKVTMVLIEIIIAAKGLASHFIFDNN